MPSCTEEFGQVRSCLVVRELGAYRSEGGGRCKNIGGRPHFRVLRLETASSEGGQSKRTCRLGPGQSTVLRMVVEV